MHPPVVFPFLEHTWSPRRTSESWASFLQCVVEQLRGFFWKSPLMACGLSQQWRVSRPCTTASISLSMFELRVSVSVRSLLLYSTGPLSYASHVGMRQLEWSLVSHCRSTGANQLMWLHLWFCLQQTGVQGPTGGRCSPWSGPIGWMIWRLGWVQIGWGTASCQGRIAGRQGFQKGPSCQLLPFFCGSGLRPLALMMWPKNGISVHLILHLSALKRRPVSRARSMTALAEVSIVITMVFFLAIDDDVISYASYSRWIAKCFVNLLLEDILGTDQPKWKSPNSVPAMRWVKGGVKWAFVIQLYVPIPAAGVNDRKILCTIQFGKNLI